LKVRAHSARNVSTNQIPHHLTKAKKIAREIKVL